MISYLNPECLQSLETKIDEKAPDLFKAKPEKPQLKAIRLLKTKTEEGEEITRVTKYADVADFSRIKALENESSDLSQVFVIRQDRSWTTLNISHELFRDFVSVHNVFPQFWKFVFAFGRKFMENEFEFPGFRAMHTYPSISNSSEIYELAYILRRAELNHRELEEGQSPWSIRQTAVYHKFTLKSNSSKHISPRAALPPQGSRSTFLLIAPSQTIESQVSDVLELSISDESASTPWNVHRLLLAESLRGWMEYMAGLEERLREQSDRIVLAKVGAEKESFSPLTDFNINFIDRQNLKIIEDSVIDLQIILSTMLNTVIRLCDQCKKCCERHCKKGEGKCDCEQIIEEFDEYVKEVEMHAERAKILRERSKSTSQLLSDLLSYEDAVALKDLAQESQVERMAMCDLTARSTKDAAAVKVLTVISLVYLPTTIVANFFSTQFVHVTDSGDVQVSARAWLLAAIAIPLTVLTIAMWWMWARHTNIALSTISRELGIPRFQRHNKLWSLLSPTKKHRPGDMECGTFSARSIRSPTDISKRGFCDSGVGTWSTLATPVKSEK